MTTQQHTLTANSKEPKTPMNGFFLAVEQNAQLFYVVDDHTDPWTESETVIFIHGFTESTPAWHSWVPHFSRNYRVIRFDQRGFGLSGAVEASFEYTTDLLIRDLKTLIKTVSPNKPVHLVGGKSGNICAIATALADPELIKSITMVTPAIKAPESTGWLDHIDQHGVESWARWTMGERLGSKMPKEGVEWWIHLMGQTSVSTTHAYLNWVSQVNLEPELHGIQQPVLIVGNESKRRGRAQFASYESAIPQARLEMIDVDGYHTGAVAPDQSSQVVRQFIDQFPKK
ncbi:alpha/beta fold hydrolase [Polynucleobacter kasalickyi]|uniref:Pimeloyl-ACP methyl ester carboxylesterase n=1 Tax=Polynucleobacter kasalickyi TaxID=1938817 RepID=A0A1W1Z7R8_9BURK|nr:alpha/beta fold hydrolase [Polynucleobacter kasalickyi]SMC44191.1 Pimeloyl-ACP methyl ester carboxylesterase [Polynucleobacter kasalickyi]